MTSQSTVLSSSREYSDQKLGTCDGIQKIQRSDTILPQLQLCRRSTCVLAQENNGHNKLTKLLLNVTIERSLGPVQVVMSLEKTVQELIEAAIHIYLKEKRRPLLNQTDPRLFELHYSQFSFESLNPKEKLINLGSRNFFLCLKPATTVVLSIVNSNSCSNQAKKSTTNFPNFIWTRFMDFLL